MCICAEAGKKKDVEFYLAMIQNIIIDLSVSGTDQARL